MIYTVVSVRDFKSGFLPPQFDINDLTAARNFEVAVLSGQANNLFFSHPEDYALFRLGTFDSDTGRFELDEMVELLTASQVIDKAQRSKGVVDDVG